MRVTIADYGVGNLHSVAKAIAGAGATVQLEDDMDRITGSEALVLPGVGAFAPAAARLAPVRDALRTRIADGLPVLGICLGMQLLFAGSDEGAGGGLGVFPGRVTRLRARRSPQLGWNVVDWRAHPSPAIEGFREAYYANSFVCRPTDPSDVIAWSVHESDRFAAAVRRGTCLGVQFHPEKSGSRGVAFIQAWVRSLDRAVPSPSAGVAR